MEVTASDDAAWAALVERVMTFYAESLFNANWGEQLRFEPGRRLSLAMLCHSLDADQLRETWAPFIDWIRSRSDRYALSSEPLVMAIPGSSFWDPTVLKSMPGLVIADDRPGANVGDIYWAANRGEAGQILHAYKSLWLPADLLQAARRPELVEALLAAARVWPVALHTNKGLAGGSADALTATRETATNPAVCDAFALAICAADAPPAWPGIPGHEPDPTQAETARRGVDGAMAGIEPLAPSGACYMSEADYFAADWRENYWGANYTRLQNVKRTWDPDNILHGHHCVET